jgi:tetratricopeptide (TPR) repeat protein
MSPDADVAVEDFESLFHGEPQAIEQRLVALRARASVHPDKALAPRIESQIALAQAMQKQYSTALDTLDAAEKIPGAALPAAKIQLLIERGRVSHQAFNFAAALPAFIAAWEFGRTHNLDPQAVNAAHMAAIAAIDPAEKVRWNENALELAQTSPDPKASAWITVLYNNLAQSLVAAGRYPAAHEAFETCRQRAATENNSLVERGARWGIARALRGLGQTQTAIQIQQQLLAEYNQLEESALLPQELINFGRGLVFEELAELLWNDSQTFASKALQDLGINEWFRVTEPRRWQRLQQICSGRADQISQPAPLPRNPGDAQ